jgi:hypothetical protein
MSGPLSRHELDSIIAKVLDQYDQDIRAAWARIRIEPEKWRCKVSSESFAEFWVLAQKDGEVLWFNDVEDVFVWSAYTSRGTIDEYSFDEYSSDCRSFTEIIERIAQQHSEAARSRVREGDVPASLQGPGTIVFRQTTYWELRSAGGTTYRVHFRQKSESVFATADYSTIDLHERHPLLVEYTEPLRSLYFSGAPRDPAKVVERLAVAIHDVSESWRSLQHYAGPAEKVELMLRAGNGNLMNAPEAICSIVARVLEDEGVQPSILGSAAPRLGKRALLLGRSYVIASGFTFEERRAA